MIYICGCASLISFISKHLLALGARIGNPGLISRYSEPSFHFISHFSHFALLNELSTESCKLSSAVRTPSVKRQTCRVRHEALTASELKRSISRRYHHMHIISAATHPPFKDGPTCISYSICYISRT